MTASPGRRALWLLGPLALGLVTCQAIAPTMVGPDESELVVSHPWVVRGAAGAAAAWWVGLTVVGVATRGRRGPEVLTLAAAAALLLVTGVLANLKEGFGWRPIADRYGFASSEHVARDGTTYRAFSQRWLEGGVTVGRLERAGWFSSTYRLLVMGDLGRGPLLVLPAGTDRSSPLVVRNGCVASVWRSGACAVAATLDGRPLMGNAPWNSGRPGWHYNKEEMSAFRLIGPEDALDEDSVELVEGEIAAAAAGAEVHLRKGSHPRDEDLVEALDSPHAGVRSAAMRFARAGTRALFPVAHAKLDR